MLPEADVALVLPDEAEDRVEVHHLLLPLLLLLLLLHVVLQGKRG